MVATAQKELNLYSGLAQATRERVSPDKGKIAETKKEKRKIERLWNDTVARILGVLMVPDGSSTQQKIKLEKSTKAWTDR
eukprot:12466040-Ditylum_brightwellii.AAC.1